ncbi:MAG: VWA domain-containing protein [Candidatus Acidiferrales bacterium]
MRRRFPAGCWTLASVTVLALAIPRAAQPAQWAGFIPDDRAGEATAASIPTPEQKISERSLRMDVNMVLVPVMVTDVTDHPVMGLEKSNFALYQDGEEQQIGYFSTEDAPLSVGLILDLSKSMSAKFDMERAAVSEFFKNANGLDDYFVITFSDRPKLVSGETQSIEAIESRLALQVPDGNTALFDAISEGASHLRSAQYRRKALLIISDGGDNHSRHHLKEIKRVLQDSDLQVYAIGIFDTGSFRSLEESLGRAWLGKITGATGGRVAAVDRASKIPEAAATISREIRSQYVLGYRPNATGGDRRRKIKVQVTPTTGAMALHTYYKTGYVPSDATTARSQ